MLAIAFIGTIQHEVAADVTRKLVDKIRAEANCSCVVACNANGLFATATKLDKQLEMLFDSGIDLVMVGEQAISRNSCRSVFAKGQLPLLKPINLAGSTEDKSIKKIMLEGCELCFISAVDGTSKVPVEHSYIKLDEFLRNKSKDSVVIINESGTDYKYLSALAWRYSKLGGCLLILGSGTGEATRMLSCFGEKCCLQCDVGSVVVEDTICGIEPEKWWSKNIDRRPLTLLPKWGSLRCDYTMVWVNERRIEKYCSKSVRM